MWGSFCLGFVFEFKDRETPWPRCWGRGLVNRVARGIPGLVALIAPHNDQAGTQTSGRRKGVEIVLRGQSVPWSQVTQV